jgi:hypothetical protein
MTTMKRTFPVGRTMAIGLALLLLLSMAPAQAAPPLTIHGEADVILEIIGVEPHEDEFMGITDIVAKVLKIEKYETRATPVQMLSVGETISIEIVSSGINTSEMTAAKLKDGDVVRAHIRNLDTGWEGSDDSIEKVSNTLPIYLEFYGIYIAIIIIVIVIIAALLLWHKKKHLKKGNGKSK